jgi:signal transduction histidine kinase
VIGPFGSSTIFGSVNAPACSWGVRDSGPGLAPATLERLFDAFYTMKPSGLGLGLSICRSIIETHGGRLWATANVPRGAHTDH